MARMSKLHLEGDHAPLVELVDEERHAAEESAADHAADQARNEAYGQAPPRLPRVDL